MDRTTTLRFAAIFLWLVALFFAAAGLGGWFAPAAYTSLFDVELPNAHATTDARATYGGANLGVGLFLGWAAMRRERLGVGLIAGIAVGGAMGVGRTTGIVVDGTREAIQWAFLAMEVGGVLIALWLLRALRRDGGEA